MAKKTSAGFAKMSEKTKAPPYISVLKPTHNGVGYRQV